MTVITSGDLQGVAIWAYSIGHRPVEDEQTYYSDGYLSFKQTPLGQEFATDPNTWPWHLKTPRTMTAGLKILYREWGVTDQQPSRLLHSILGPEDSDQWDTVFGDLGMPERGPDSADSLRYEYGFDGREDEPLTKALLLKWEVYDGWYKCPKCQRILPEAAYYLGVRRSSYCMRCHSQRYKGRWIG